MLWVVGQADRSVRGRRWGWRGSSRRTSAAALEAEPTADPERLLRESFGARPAERLRRPAPTARVVTNRPIHRRAPRRCSPGARRGLTRPRRRPRRRAGTADCAAPRSPALRVGGELRGAVVVAAARRPASRRRWRPTGPALLGAGALLLVVGTLGVMFFVLAPARRRLRFARASGCGARRRRYSRRARRRAAATRSPRSSAAFNRMADELASAARRAASSVRSRAPAAAGRRLARADDAADRDSRLPRNAGDAGRACATQTTRERYVRIVTEETLRAGSASSATCSTWRGSRAAARTIEPPRCLVSCAVRAGRRAPRRRYAAERGITMTTTHRARGGARARRCPVGSNRRCRTSSPTRVRHTPDGGARCRHGDPASTTSYG